MNGVVGFGDTPVSDSSPTLLKETPIKPTGSSSWTLVLSDFGLSWAPSLLGEQTCGILSTGKSLVTEHSFLKLVPKT